MDRRRVILSLALVTALFGVGSLIYGFAKIAMAEEPREMSVEIDLPNAVALTAPDTRARSLGYRACGLGGICLFAAAALYALNLGASSNSHRGSIGKPDDLPFAEKRLD